MTPLYVPNIFHYQNYREFLKDYYVERKSTTTNFSYRYFARKAGVGAPNHLKRIIDGQRNLSRDARHRYVEALDLNADESDYFLALVSFNQAKSQPEKQNAYEKLKKFNGYQKVHELDIHHDAYHEHWYIPAIRELAICKHFVPDPKWISEQLVPHVSVRNVKNAIRTLEALGIFTTDENGSFKVSSQALSTGNETKNLHMRTFHRSMLHSAIESIDTFPQHARDISSLTFAASPDGLERIKSMIQRFRKEIIAVATEEEKNGRQVLQVNIQLFPLSSDPSDHETS